MSSSNVNLYKFSSREMPTKAEEFHVKLETQVDQINVPLTELKSMLDQVGLDLPNYKVIDLRRELKCSKRTDGNNLSSKSG